MASGPGMLPPLALGKLEILWQRHPLGGASRGSSGHVLSRPLAPPQAPFPVSLVGPSSWLGVSRHRLLLVWLPHQGLNRQEWVASWVQRPEVQGQGGQHRRLPRAVREDPPQASPWLIDVLPLCRHIAAPRACLRPMFHFRKDVGLPGGRAALLQCDLIACAVTLTPDQVPF